MISFIVPAHNEQACLGRTLSAIHTSAKAVGRPYEVIVVDDGSTDGTPAMLAGMKTSPVDLTVIRQGQSGPALARNRGAAVATGEVLAFLDDDTLAPPGWLLALNSAFDDHPEAQGIGAPPSPVTPNGLDKRRVGNGSGSDASMPLAFEPQKWISTHNLAVQRSAFEAVRGFLPESVCQDEDLDFLYRLLQQGFVLIKTNRSAIYHRSRESLGGIIRQQFHFGRTDVHIFRRFFPGQLVWDFPVGRFLHLRDFGCCRNFPFNACLRLDFLKGFLVSLACMGWWFWLPLVYLFLLWGGIFLHVRKPRFALALLGTLLLRDAAYLAGHVRGSCEIGALYL